MSRMSNFSSSRPFLIKVIAAFLIIQIVSLFYCPWDAGYSLFEDLRKFDGEDLSYRVALEGIFDVLECSLSVMDNTDFTDKIFKWSIVIFLIAFTGLQKVINEKILDKKNMENILEKSAAVWFFDCLTFTVVAYIWWFLAKLFYILFQINEELYLIAAAAILLFLSAILLDELYYLLGYIVIMLIGIGGICLFNDFLWRVPNIILFIPNLILGYIVFFLANKAAEKVKKLPRKFDKVFKKNDKPLVDRIIEKIYGDQSNMHN